MIIPSIPTTLAEMLNFLQPTVQDGLFDSVAYDDADTPTKIVCTQGGNTILEITASGSIFTFNPYVADGIAATGRGMTTPLSSCFRCKGGVYFISNLKGAPEYYYRFVIAKTSSGKTGFIKLSNVQVNTEAALRLYPTCYGDNTSLNIYTNGYCIYMNYYNQTYDRTVLSKIPVAGENGSTDYFTGCFIRSAFQFAETGVQSIGGKSYGCSDCFAILDE